MEGKEGKEEGTYSEPRVEARAAGDDDESPRALHVGEIVAQAAEEHLTGVEANAAAHRVRNRLGLLEYLLLHEVLVLAAHYLGELELEFGDLAVLVRVAWQCAVRLRWQSECEQLSARPVRD